MKIAVVTSYFPIAVEPYRGHSAFQTLRRMPPEASITVFVPLAAYPEAKWLTPSRFRYYRPNLTYRPPGFQTTYFTYPALPLISRPLNGLVSAHYLKRFLEDDRPDVILNYSLYPDGFAAVRVGRQLGIPVIVGSLGSDLRRIDSLTKHMVRYTLKHASAVLTVSEELRRRAIGMGVPPDRVTTVLNGIDTSRFHLGDRAAARRELDLASDWELVLFVGSMLPSKGLAEFMDAMISLSASRPHLRVALIGEGSYIHTIRQQAAVAGLSDRFLFLGGVPSTRVATWMTACDLFCLPSHSEGCPNAVIEALASGRPVVATSVGGIPELVNEECGILVPVKDPVKLREAVDLALCRPWDQNRIARHSRRGWEDAARETYELCCRVSNLSASVCRP
jgi:glycosyltransferase involved in cell wall biosynthesis